MPGIKEKYINIKRKLFDKAYGKRLNPEQCQAVFTTEGPLLVLAGAGSGKTTVLVNRIVYIIKYGNAYFSEYAPENISEEEILAYESLLEKEPDEIECALSDFAHSPVSPWSVLAITFTNKAAREIKTRLDTAFGDTSVSESVWSGTFHSVCMRILRKFGDRAGLRDGFSIYDTDDKKRLISACMKELDIDEKRLSPKPVASAISKAKDELKSPDDLEGDADPRNRDIIRIYKLYQKRLMEYNAVDFDDIIMKTVELLMSDSEVLSYYQSKFRYVLVDEYQDTNYAQFVLTKLLSDGYRNIMVVGDDDQSIYKFRGATIENILNFDKNYPDAFVVKLEQNYRSTENILNAANSIIKNNSDRHEKSLWCKRGQGEKITLREAEDQNAEGRYIIDKINLAVKGGRSFSDFAVLYRINALGRTLQTAFAKSGIPYKVVGDMGFYDRKEVKDMLAYLTVLASPSDNLRLKRIINEPKRKIGDASVNAVEQIAAAEGLSMYEIMTKAGDYTALGKVSGKLLDFVKLIEEIKSEKTLPSELISELFYRSGYHEMLVAEGFEGEGKIDNVKEFIGAAVEYEARCAESGESPTTHGFLEEISLITDLDKYDENTDAVVLMTVHAAKGLEFPVVFLAGMEDGIFPSQQNIGEADEISEERRLAYVAITRAKEKLFITHAKCRMMYGKTEFNRLSGFIRNEVPTTLIESDNPRPSYQPKPRMEYQQRVPFNSELNRKPNIEKTRLKGAAEYGIEKFPVGTRVMHQVFGEGEILSARDMGGDVLYEVKFDNGQVKRLMSTFAKLRRI